LHTKKLTKKGADMLNLAQKQEVSAQVKALVELANSKLNANMGLPNIKFDLRGSTAGTARGDFELDFNAQLLVDNFELYKTDTIIHEVAHLVDHNINGSQYKYTRRGPQRVSHGPTWKNIMRQLGGDPTRTHNMDVSKTAQPKRKFIYVCDCCKKELTLTSVRHNKLLRNPNQYSHCIGYNLTFKQALGKVSYAEAAQMKNTKPATKPATKATPKPKAPVAKKTPAKKKVVTKKPTVKKGKTKTELVLNAYQSILKSKPAITRPDMIKALMKKFKLANDAKGKARGAAYYNQSKKVVEA